MKKSKKSKKISLMIKRLFAFVFMVAIVGTLVTIFVGGGTKVYADGDEEDEITPKIIMDNRAEVEYFASKIPAIGKTNLDEISPFPKENAPQENGTKKNKLEAAVLRERCKSIGKTINAVGGMIAQAIKGGEMGPHALTLAKSSINLAVTLWNKIPGFGEVTDAVFDAFVAIVESFDGSKQSDTERLMNFIEDQINLVRDDIAKTRQDIVELSSKVDDGFNSVLTALKDSFENYEAKTRVNDFFSTSSGSFSYTQLKRYFFSNYTDGYALELQTEIAKKNPNQERLTSLENNLYKALMSTSINNRSSYIEMFYDSIMQTESHRSIFEYYVDFLSSNSKYLGDMSPELASIEFMNDVYCSFMSAVNCIRLLNQKHKAQLVLKIQDAESTDFDELKFVYGPDQNDYVTYNDLDKIDARLEEMLNNVDYQVSQDLAYISRLDKTYFYKASDNVFRVAYNSNPKTFGNVERNFTVYFPELKQDVAELFGYNVNNFRYVLTDKNNNQINTGEEKKTTYHVDTFGSFLLTVKYDVIDKDGSQVMTTDSNGDSIPLVYDMFKIQFHIGVEDSFSGGTGKADDPYIISNYHQFLMIRNLDRHTCYSLISDLDFGSRTIEQMFDDVTPYAGTFNGNGFTLTDFKIGKSKNQSSLFGFIASTGTVKNLTIKGITVNKDNDDNSVKMEAAILAGVNNGTISQVIIDSCSVKAVRVSKTNNDNINKAITNYTGAIAAENYGSITYCKVKNCTISGYSKREYGSNSDGLNSNDIYAGGAVGYNGSGATLKYISVDSSTKISAEGNGIADKAFSTRAPRVKAYAGGITGLAGDRNNINNLYCETTNINASAKCLNDAALGITSESNATSKVGLYIAGESAGNISRSSDFEFPKGDSYSYEMLFSGKVDQTYNIDESLIFDAGAIAFNVTDMKIKVKNISAASVNTYKAAILSVKGFNSFNDSITEAVKRDAEVLVYIEEINKVLNFSVPYYILPDKPLKLIVVGPGNTEFEYSDNPDDSIFNQNAGIVLNTAKINLVLQSGAVINVAQTALISIDRTQLGKQNAKIKVDNYIDESFEVRVVCSNHTWINEKTVVEGFEKINVGQDEYYIVYGYISRECSTCHAIIHEGFKTTCQSEIVNAVPATCSSTGYTGDRIPYYIKEATTQEKEYYDIVIEKGTIIEQLPHIYQHEDDMNGDHYDDYGHTCSVCGHIEPHLYSPVETAGEIVNGIVYKCETCGHTVIKENISRDEISKLPRVVVNNAYALPGTQDVVVYVDLHSNSGITSANFSVSFDSNLTLVSYKLGNILNDANISRFKIYPDHINVVLAQSSTDVSTDGTLLKLVFETPSNSVANSRYKINVVNQGNTDRFTDNNGNKVEFLSFAGCINVVDRLPGDVNGDGKLDMLDVLITSKFIVLDELEKANYIKEMTGLNSKLSIGFADVNLDNIIDTDDVVRMLRFDVGGYESQVMNQKFIVNLNYNDGSGTVVPYLVDYNYGNGTYGNLPSPLKSGYRFDGWYKNIDGTGDPVVSSSSVQYNSDQYVQTLYAHYTINKIIFDSNGGVGEKPAITVNSSSDIKNFGINDKNGNPYFVNEITVKFDANVDDSNLNKIDTYNLTFLGWSTTKDGNVISNINSVYNLANLADSQIGTVTLYAVWKEIEIGNYSPNTASIPGYNLAGWMLKKNGKASDIVFAASDSKYTVNSNITFYAKYDLIKYTITYDGNGGKTIDGYSNYFENDIRTSLASLKLRDIDLIGFKKNGYTFAGWTTDQAFAENWFYLVKKNYNTIISGFDYTYYDGEKKTVEDTDFVFINEAMLQASANPNPAVTRDGNNFITAGLVESLEDLIDENGYVTLYALWTPNKTEIEYTTTDEIAKLKETSLFAKDNPVTLPYYYGYDIELAFDIFHYKADSYDGRRRIIEISFPSKPFVTNTYKIDTKTVVYADELPVNGGTFTANVVLNDHANVDTMYIHYIYNGYELFTDHYEGWTNEEAKFAKDLSVIGISDDYYTIGGYLSIIDSNGNDGLDFNKDGNISPDETYINCYKPGSTLFKTLIGPDEFSRKQHWHLDHPDIYIEVQIIGERKLYYGEDGYTGPFVLDDKCLILNGIGIYSPIRDNNIKEILIIPDLVRVDGVLVEIKELSCQSIKPTSDYDNENNNKSFKTLLLGKNIKVIHKEIKGYLKTIKEIILPANLDWAWISNENTNVKRIVLSNLKSLVSFVVPKTDDVITIYYRGSYEDFVELMVGYPQSRIFDKEHYRVKFYSETEPTISGIPNDNYWYNDNGVIRTWAD